MDGEDVGLLDAARIDALMGLHRRKRGETVAVDGGALELERRGSLLHLRCQPILHGLALAREEGVGFAHELAVIGKIDLASARAGAALDLVEETGPRAALEERARARPHPKAPFEGCDC